MPKEELFTITASQSLAVTSAFLSTDAYLNKPSCYSPCRQLSVIDMSTWVVQLNLHCIPRPVWPALDHVMRQLFPLRPVSCSSSSSPLVPLEMPAARGICTADCQSWKLDLKVTATKPAALLGTRKLDAETTNPFPAIHTLVESYHHQYLKYLGTSSPVISHTKIYTLLNYINIPPYFIQTSFLLVLL